MFAAERVAYLLGDAEIGIVPFVPFLGDGLGNPIDYPTLASGAHAIRLAVDFLPGLAEPKRYVRAIDYAANHPLAARTWAGFQAFKTGMTPPSYGPPGPAVPLERTADKWIRAAHTAFTHPLAPKIAADVRALRTSKPGGAPGPSKPIELQVDGYVKGVSKGLGLYRWYKAHPWAAYAIVSGALGVLVGVGFVVGRATAPGRGRLRR